MVGLWEGKRVLERGNRGGDKREPKKGRGGRCNRAGQRPFCLSLSDDLFAVSLPLVVHVAGTHPASHARMQDDSMVKH